MWVDELEAPGALTEDQAMVAAETGRCLQEVLLDARSAGISDRMLVPWNSTSITLAATKLADYVATSGSRGRNLLETERLQEDASSCVPTKDFSNRNNK